MFANSHNDFQWRLGQNPTVGSDGNVVGEMARKWREHLKLTLEGFGELFDPPWGRSTVHNVESGRYKNQIDTILAVIAAIEKGYGQSFGATDSLRLATFFRGPRKGRKR